MNPRDIPVRFSRLKYMAQSPAHYLHFLKNEREDSPSLRSGRLLHYLLLGGSYGVYDGSRQTNAWEAYVALRDNSPYVEYSGGSRRGKAWKDFRDDHKAATVFLSSEIDEAKEMLRDLGNGDVFTSKEVARHAAMAESVLSHPDAASLLKGQRELQLDWSWLGRACTGRLDVLGTSWIADLKSADDAEPNRFQWMARRYAYHAQLAWYRIGAGDITRDCYLISVETKAPHPVVVHHLTEAALDQGERLCRLWMERLRTCEESGHWPGYAQSIVDFDAVELDDVTLSIDGEEVAA